MSAKLDGALDVGRLREIAADEMGEHAVAQQRQQKLESGARGAAAMGQIGPAHTVTYVDRGVQLHVDYARINPDVIGALRRFVDFLAC